MIESLNQDKQDLDIKPPQDAAGAQKKTNLDRSLRPCGVLRRFDYLLSRQRSAKSFGNVILICF